MINNPFEKEKFYEALCSECEREGLAYRREPEHVYIEDFAYFVYISEKKIKARNLMKNLYSVTGGMPLT